MNEKLFCGIDVGKKGGIAIIDDSRKVLFLRIMADECLREAADLMKQYENQCMVFIEKVAAMPGQGVTSMFNFGKSAGFVEGIMYGNRIPYELIPPQKWKKEFSLFNKDKQESIKVCKQLFPGVNLLPSSRCTKESDGMAEALLIAEVCRRTFIRE